MYKAIILIFFVIDELNICIGCIRQLQFELIILI